MLDNCTGRGPPEISFSSKCDLVSRKVVGAVDGYSMPPEAVLRAKARKK